MSFLSGRALYRYPFFKKRRPVSPPWRPRARAPRLPPFQDKADAPRCGGALDYRALGTQRGGNRNLICVAVINFSDMVILFVVGFARQSFICPPSQILSVAPLVFEPDARQADKFGATTGAPAPPTTHRRGPGATGVTGVTWVTGATGATGVRARFALGPRHAVAVAALQR